MFALGQDSPDMVLGTSGGEYGLFTPDEVRSGESDATPPTPEAEGTYELSRRADGTLGWALQTPLARSLYEVFTSDGSVPTVGSLLDVGFIDTGSRTASVGTIPLGGRGRILQSSGTISKWVTVESLGIRQLPANPSGTAHNFLRATSAGPSWVGGEIAPHFTSGNADACLRVNQLGTGVSWRACPSGGGGETTPLSDQTPLVESGTGAAGSATAASRGDHVHPAAGGGVELSDALPAPLAFPRAAGTGTEASRDDHVHPIADVLATTEPLPLAASAVVGSGVRAAHAEHVHPWTGLRQVPDPATVPDGHVLTVNSAAYSWAAPGGGGGGGGVKKLAEVARSADDECVFALPWADVGMREGDLFVVVIANAAGGHEFQSLQFIATALTPVLTPTSTQFVYLEGTNGAGKRTSLAFGPTSASVPIVLGGTCQLLRIRAGGGGGGGTATPLSDGAPLALGATASAGTGTAASRGDHVHPTTGIPAPADSATAVKTGSAAPGTSKAYSRADHAHNFSLYDAQEPAGVAVDTPGAAGSSTLAARADHSHRASTAAFAAGLHVLRPPVVGDFLADEPIVYNAGAVGHSLDTGAALGDMPTGPVYLKVTDPDHASGNSFSLWTTRAVLQALPAIGAGSMASQTRANHVILRDAGGNARGYFAGRLNNGNLWVSAPATTSGGGTLVTTALPDASWGAYFTARQRPAVVWTHTADAATWGGGVDLPLATGLALWRSMRDHAVPLYRELWLDVSYVQSGNPATTHVGRLTLPTARIGGSPTSNQTRLAGLGRVHSASLNGYVSFQAGEPAQAGPGEVGIVNCTFCTSGQHSFAVTLWGVPR